jgi:hypothetical protein
MIKPGKASQEINYPTQLNSYNLHVKNPILITPVKDSLKTTREVIQSLRSENSEIPYYIFEDYCSRETRRWLEENSARYTYKIIYLDKHVRKSSPNYRTTLIMARQMALENDSHLAIVESDVYADHETIESLTRITEELTDAGLVGAVTVDNSGEINFPYSYATAIDKPLIFASAKSVSFCCTILTNQLLQKFDFNELPHKMDWFDVYVSKKSRQLGFSNYVVKSLPVLHKPHSSRPWKHLKYKNPLLYYFKKLIKQRDRI